MAVVVERLKSRIHMFMSPDVIKSLDRLCMDKTIGDNNEKAELMLSTLNEFGIDYIELGPGTNRLAILIDNYVFKLALDFQGKRDNINEFKLSHELQPHVTKTYENNDLMCVQEYVTLISREEFIARKPEMTKILALLAESYLLGDVGTVPKNFCNWGMRDDGSLVILDYAHIYRVDIDQIICRFDREILEFDQNFHDMRCPKCGKTYKFIDVRRLIPYEQEYQENELMRQLAHKLKTPYLEIKKEDLNMNTPGFAGQQKNIRPSKYKFGTKNEEEVKMAKYDLSYDEHDELDDAADELLALKQSRGSVKTEITTTVETKVTDNRGVTVTNESNILVDEGGKQSSLTVYKQHSEEIVPLDELGEYTSSRTIDIDDSGNVDGLPEGEFVETSSSVDEEGQSLEDILPHAPERFAHNKPEHKSDTYYSEDEWATIQETIKDIEEKEFEEAVVETTEVLSSLTKEETDVDVRDDVSVDSTQGNIATVHEGEVILKREMDAPTVKVIVDVERTIVNGEVEKDETHVDVKPESDEEKRERLMRELEEDNDDDQYEHLREEADQEENNYRSNTKSNWK